MNKKQLEKEISKITQELVEKYKPEKIILFGSAAWGEFSRDSDLDFLIIKDDIDHLNSHERLYRVRQLIPNDLAIDFIVYAPYEMKKRVYLEDPFIKKVLEEGWTLYGT